MAPCNMQIMMRFSCEELHEKRARANLNIARDQRDRDRLRSEVRRMEIDLANRRVEIRRLHERVPEPAVGGGVQVGRDGKPRRPKPWQVLADVAQAAAGSSRNQRDIRRLEREIERLEESRSDLRQELWRQVERLNEAVAGRSCINEALRRKGCVGA